MLHCTRIGDINDLTTDEDNNATARKSFYSVKKKYTNKPPTIISTVKFIYALIFKKTYIKNYWNRTVSNCAISIIFGVNISA